MGYRSTFLSFLLIICTSSMVHCSLLGDNILDRNIIPDITGISRVRVTGVLSCPFPPVVRNELSLPAGLNVALTCGEKRTVISDAVTDTSGFFEITLNTVQTSLLHPDQCDNCRIAVRGTSASACIVYPGRRGALLAPINCHDTIVETLHGDEQGRGTAVHYKAEPFYFDPSYY
ncbi:hypothetical protein L484_022736 [Morus notabilis]|uniref:Pollen Ole e 1 allergen and extensin family protein n=1 Tax=Morus notabilis TaxID=981085 RepID=W9SMM0_9ROSA|nr:hypothetical protein L484_022736 [Morus notabilis]